MGDRRRNRRSDPQAAFLADVHAHELEIVHDVGLSRHLKFRGQEPHAWLHWFDIVTWPGSLCIRGDCGTYVFSRIADMFCFFRNQPKTPGSLYINDGYWAEKLVASDCSGRRGAGVLRFDSDLFERAVKRRFVEHVRENLRGDPDGRKSLRAALEEDVLSYANESQVEAFRAASNFEHGGFTLSDFWEEDCEAYHPSFIWCLYAISWGIQRYDMSKKQAPPPPDVAGTLREALEKIASMSKEHEHDLFSATQVARAALSSTASETTDG